MTPPRGAQPVFRFVLASVVFIVFAIALVVVAREAVAYASAPSCRKPIAWPPPTLREPEDEFGVCRDETVRIVSAIHREHLARRSQKPYLVQIAYPDDSDETLTLGDDPSDEFWQAAQAGRTPEGVVRLFEGHVVALKTAAGEAVTERMAPHNVLPLALATIALGLLDVYAFVRMHRLLRADRHVPA